MDKTVLPLPTALGGPELLPRTPPAPTVASGTAISPGRRSPHPKSPGESPRDRKAPIEDKKKPVSIESPFQNDGHRMG